jgi:hypothetical protein
MWALLVGKRFLLFLVTVRVLLIKLMSGYSLQLNFFTKLAFITSVYGRFPFSNKYSYLHCFLLFQRLEPATGSSGPGSLPQDWPDQAGHGLQVGLLLIFKSCMFFVMLRLIFYFFSVTDPDPGSFGFFG